MTTITDTDKGGQGFQKQRVYLGPSLGWSEEYVQPQSKIITSGTYVVQPGDGLLLVDATGQVTIQLPDVRVWWQQNADQPATGWNRQLCIKDFAGNASTTNILVQPFGTQTVDKNIGITAITVSNAVILLVPNVNLTGWIIAAGATALAPVGTFLPVNNPNATGKLTVREIGGDIAFMQGGAPGSQAVHFGADAASVDATVNVQIESKGSGGVNSYSNGSLQVVVAGPAGTNDYLVLSGSTGLDDPKIATGTGGPVRIDEAILVGPSGGNFAGLFGSAVSGQSVSVRADNASNPDTTINIDLVPKGGGSVLFWSNGAQQAQISGPASAARIITMQGSVAGNPIIQTLGGGSIEIPNLVMTGNPTAPTPPLDDNDTSVINSKWIRDNNFVQHALPDPGILFDKLAGYTDVKTQIQAISMPPAGLKRSGPTLVLADDLLALENLSGIDVIYYRSGTSTWSPVVIGTGLNFTGGTLTATGGGGGGGDVFLANNQTFTGVNTFAPAAGNNAIILGTSPGGSPPLLAISSATPSRAGAQIFNWAADATSAAITAFKSRGGTVGTHAAVQSGDVPLNLSAQGSDGTAFKTCATINITVDGAPGTQIPGRIGFYTATPTVTASERMRITNTGGVSIVPPFTDPGQSNFMANNITAGISITGALKGVADNSAGGAGFVGEYKEAIVSSSTALTSATITTINSLVLTAGDWHVWCHTGWVAGSVIGTAEMELASPTATLSGDIRTYAQHMIPTVGNTTQFDLSAAQFRIPAGGATVFLIARSGQASMSVANSIIKARRMR